jgi:hypothetical protein
MVSEAEIEVCLDEVLRGPSARREDLDRLTWLAENYHPFGDVPADPLLSLMARVFSALASLTQSPFTRLTNALMGLAIRGMLGLLRDKRGLLRVETAPEPFAAAIARGVATFDLCERLFGETSSILYYKAALHYWRGTIEIAYSLFDRFRGAFDPEHGYQLDQKGCFSTRSLGDIVNLARTDVVPDRNAVIRRREPRRYVIVACCDVEYFRLYLPRLLESLSRHDDVAVHCHVATDAPGAIAAALPASANFSFEPAPVVADPTP